jgi:hypothetical protein
MPTPSSPSPTRKLESIARLLVDTKNDHEFEVALIRARTLLKDSGLGLKDLMLAQLNITVIYPPQSQQGKDHISSEEYDPDTIMEKFIAEYQITRSERTTDWVSIQVIYKNAMPYFISYGKKMSSKAFAQQFCKKVGAHIVLGGHELKYKGFLITSNREFY